MCKRYATGQKGTREERRAGQELRFRELGFDEFSEVRIEPKLTGKWAGSARLDKLQSWWLSKRFPGNELVVTDNVVTEVSETDQITGEAVFVPAPAGTRLYFVLEASPPGKTYRLAKLVTTKATPEELAYFRQENDSVPFTGRISEYLTPEPVPLPKPPPRPQGELL